MGDKEQDAINYLRASGLEAEASAVEALRTRHKTTMEAFHKAQQASYAGGMCAERDRIRAYLQDMQDQSPHHNFYKVALVAIFGS